MAGSRDPNSFQSLGDKTTSRQPTKTVIVIGCILIFGIGLLLGCPFTSFLDLTQKEFFHKSICEMRFKGNGFSYLSDLDCDEFFSNQQHGEEYCKQKILNTNLITDYKIDEAQLTCIYACCQVDGSCYGCQALHGCICHD